MPENAGLVQHGAANRVRMVFEGVIPREGSTWVVHYPWIIKFRSAILRSVGVQ